MKKILLLLSFTFLFCVTSESWAKKAQGLSLRPRSAKAEVFRAKKRLRKLKRKGKKRVSFFFELNFTHVNKNGEREFHSERVRKINLKSALKFYAREQGLGLKELKGLSYREYQNIFTSLRDVFGWKNLEKVKAATLIVSMSQLDTKKEMMSLVQRKTKGWNFSQRARLYAAFGGYFSDNYDYGLIDDNKEPDYENPETKKLIQNLSDNLFGNKDIDAGLCRHIHHAMLEIAVAAGDEHVFGLGYSTVSAAHRIMIMTDKESPETVVQLNYSHYAEKKNVAGTSALSNDRAGMSDTGIQFRIYNADQRYVLTLPSEKGAILNLMTGGKDIDLDPSFSTKSQIQQTGITTPLGTFRLFHVIASSGNNQMVSGGAYNKKFATKRNIFYGNIGIAGYYTQRRISNGKMTQKGFYANTKLGVNIPIVRKKRIKLDIPLEGNYRFAGFKSRMEDNTGEVKFNYDTFFKIKAGVRLYMRYKKIHTTSQVFLGGSIFGKDSVAPAHLNSAFLATPNLSFLQNFTFRVGKKSEIAVNGKLIRRDLGTQVYWQGSGDFLFLHRPSKFGVRLGAEGRLTSSTPYWMPGAQRTIGGDISVGVGKKRRVLLGGQTQVSIEERANAYFGLGIKGKF